MARGSDPESRPISVAELMARAKEQGADDVASAVGNSPAATGRRRRGGKDGVSVAELTGEIPRVTSQPKDAQSSQPKADQSSQPKVDEESEGDRVSQPDEAPAKDDATGAADEVKAPSATPPPTRDFNTAEVSKRTDTASAVKPTPGAPDRPAFGAKPAPAEARSDSSENAATADARDEETTGVIPSMQAYSQVDSDVDDDHRVLSAAEREREFERYRNFEDVETGGNDTPSTVTKKKRGLFGFGRKAEAVAPPETGSDDSNISGHTVTQFIPKVNDESAPPSSADDVAAPAPDPAPARETEPVRSSPSRGQDGAVAASGRYLRFDRDTDTDTDNVEDGNADDADTAKSVAAADESPTSEFGRVRGGAEPDAPVARLDKSEDDTGAATASLAAPVAGSTGSAQDSDSATQPVAAAASDTATASETGDERSPAMQWLLLIGQVLAGLAVGVALFWGFTELWRWNVLFALVLSVAVIFGLVTLVHVVRRSTDLISTLLALGVGLLVTIGPLVLLLIAGD